MVCGCGASLAGVPSVKSEREVRVAINRAALHPMVQPDAWAFLDHTLYCRIGMQVPANVLRVTTRECFASAVRTVHQTLPPAVLIDERQDMPPEHLDWRRFSGTLALAYAGSLLPDGGAIDCYGVDWSGQADWDGTVWESYRRDDDPTRWHDERLNWRRLTDWLDARGVTVQRYDAHKMVQR
jgi:hypothetical protein